MIIEQHYDEEVLIGLLEEAEHDTHVPGCDTCAGTLESLRDLTGALRDDSVWDERVLSESPSAQTSNMLRAFAQRSKVEDAGAATIVPKLIATPSMIQAHPEWRTAGVVRKLLAVVDEKNFSDPKLAADLAALAVEVAESLDATQYPHDTVMKLRALAWRTNAHMLYYIGSYSNSLIALDRTDAILAECAVSEYESARSYLVRAQLYNEIERIDDALDMAARARESFAKFGDVRRVAVADATRAASLIYMRRFADALPVFERLAADSRVDDSARAFYIHNAAICYREISNIEASKVLFAKAVAEFGRLGMASARARARWHLAQVMLDEQRYEQSLALSLELHHEFEELGMAQDVALISLDAAEALLMLDRPAEVAQLCQAAMEYFSKAGLAYTQAALTVLAYLKEAATARRLTVAKIGDVRRYFELLPKQPHLLFAHPA